MHRYIRGKIKNLISKLLLIDSLLYFHFFVECKQKQYLAIPTLNFKVVALHRTWEVELFKSSAWVSSCLLV